jgi:hypothetical protein
MSASIPGSVLRIRSKQSRLFLLAQSVALTLDHERVTVMEQPVENRRGEDVVAEDGAPLPDELIGRDQQAGALVPTGDELKKEVGTASFEGQVPDLFDFFPPVSALGDSSPA